MAALPAAGHRPQLEEDYHQTGPHDDVRIKPLSTVYSRQR
jgi:hypothetical protein